MQSGPTGDRERAVRVWANVIVPCLLVGKGSRGAEGGVRLWLDP